NRGPLAHLAGRPLDDPRVTVLVGDVGAVLREAASTYDAVLLDVDNGPAALTARSNRGLYDAAGIARVARALRPGGVLAVWSVSDDASFTARLLRGGLRARTERVPKGDSGRGRHTLWLAVRAR
ncbi:MAG: spermidine synthase, partial [Polyangiaceae bacterium]|nr:spermidine synthase [Polyangiaceae bacterium]